MFSSKCTEPPVRPISALPYLKFTLFVAKSLWAAFRFRPTSRQPRLPGVLERQCRETCVIRRVNLKGDKVSLIVVSARQQCLICVRSARIDHLTGTQLLV